MYNNRQLKVNNKDENKLKTKKTHNYSVSPRGLRGAYFYFALHYCVVSSLTSCLIS